MGLWSVRTENIPRIEDVLPSTINDKIVSVERYVQNVTYIIPIESFTTYPFVKRSASESRSATSSTRMGEVYEDIIGVYIRPNKNKDYDVQLNKIDDKLFTLEIKEVKNSKFKLREKEPHWKKGMAAYTSEHKTGRFGIKPKKDKFYRIEIHVDPRNGEWHLESTESDDLEINGWDKPKKKG